MEGTSESEERINKEGMRDPFLEEETKAKTKEGAREQETTIILLYLFCRSGEKTEEQKFMTIGLEPFPDCTMANIEDTHHNNNQKKEVAR